MKPFEKFKKKLEMNQITWVQDVRDISTNLEKTPLAVTQNSTNIPFDVKGNFFENCIPYDY